MTIWSMFARVDIPLGRSYVLQSDLRKAIARRRFELHYQPIIDAARGETVALEALVRWRDPNRGLMSPDTFIGVAEESGLIDAIGLLILEDACREARCWHDRGYEIPVSINVSVRQLDRGSFVDHVFRALALSGLPPTSLWIEITETCIMRDVDAITAMVSTLRSRGVRVVIDDFGTGYSTLGRIKAFPADVLKIDRCFVKDLPGGTVDKAVVAAIMTVASSCNMEIVAEGVEHPAQVTALQELGCDLMQGFFFARPARASTINFESLSKSLV
ncbi:MAG: EAL domain-containing protein [Candidatus Eremiobacteraeota bacterium]|nr:EAL domain-containing protein [Candidatus Eremiobacteraeota bacterium]